MCGLVPIVSKIRRQWGRNRKFSLLLNTDIFNKIKEATPKPEFGSDYSPYCGLSPGGYLLKCISGALQLALHQTPSVSIMRGGAVNDLHKHSWW